MLKWTNGLRALAGILAVATMLSSTGCFVNMMALPFFLFGKEPTIDPPLKLVSGRRDSKKILVLSYADNGLKFGFDSIDEDICSLAGAAIVQGDPRLEVVPARKARPRVRAAQVHPLRVKTLSHCVPWSARAAPARARRMPARDRDRRRAISRGRAGRCERTYPWAWRRVWGACSWSDSFLYAFQRSNSGSPVFATACV